MSTTFDVVLTTPHADFSRDKIVNNGLIDLGFVAAPDQVAGATVWLMMNRKLHYFDDQKFGIEGLRDLVLALPWHDWHVDTLLQVLWSDDWTTGDDDFRGRVNPFTWNHETWTVPSAIAARRARRPPVVFD